MNRGAAPFHNALSGQRVLGTLSRGVPDVLAGLMP